MTQESQNKFTFDCEGKMIFFKTSVYLAQVRDGDESVPLPVEHPEGLPDLLLDVAVLVDVLGHQVDELVEADAAVAVLVDLVDHLLRVGKN